MLGYAEDTHKDDLFIRTVALTVIPTKGQGLTIEGLRITFDVDSSTESTPNPAKISVYNLKKSTRSLLEAKGTRIILEAGYVNQRGIIWQGDVTKVRNKKDGPAMVTEIDGADGDNAYRNSRIERSFPPGTSTRAVIQALADEMGFPVASFDNVPNTSYARGITLSGLVRKQMDDICAKNDLDWWIQDETIQIVLISKPTKDGTILISPKTGLIGSPYKTDKGIEFKCMILPKLKPGRAVKIESKDYNGFYKLLKVKPKGDSTQSDYYSTCEASAL